MRNRLQGCARGCASGVSRIYNRYLDVASCSRDSDDDETRRYKRNWIIIHEASLLMGSTYTITLSSQYQFVTNPRHPQDPNEQAGLGESDVFYSLTIAIFSIGELLASLIFSALSSWHIKLKCLMLSGLVVLVVGGLFYGVANYGWMVLVGRFLQGVYLGGQSTLLRIYIGETTNTVRDILGGDPEKSQLKNVTFLLNFMLGTLGLALAPGFAALAAQIPLVDKFRWSGWFYVFFGTVQILITLVLFKEKWTDLKRTSIQCRRLSILSGIAVPLYCIVFMIVAFFTINCALAIIETLQNPILGDNFGMDVKWSSYIFLISLSFFPVAAVTIFVLQRRRLDNRYIFLLGMSLSLAACMLITDWQAIGGDPCDKFSGPCSNGTNPEFNNTLAEEMVLESDNTSCEACRMQSGEPYYCFWNPDARISREFCPDCEPFCRSELHTVNFVQFMIGVCLFSLSFPMMRITLTVIVSDCLGSASQSLVMGILVSSGALSRCTAPLWGDAAYVAANHRTYLPILLLAGLISAVLVIYLILFRKLKPHHSINKEHETTNGNVGSGDVVELVEAQQYYSQNVVESKVTSL